MKKLALLLLSLSSFSVHAQLVLLEEGTSNLTPFFLSTGELFYVDHYPDGVFSYDGFDILNEDLSIYESITFPDYPFDPSNYEFVYRGIIEVNGNNDTYLTLYDYYVNTDPLIEFFVQISSMDIAGNRYSYLYLMDETGEYSLIHEAPEYSWLNGWGNYLTIGSEAMFNSDLYQVGGMYPCNNCGMTSASAPNIVTNNTMSLKSIPNPNFGEVVLRYELPVGKHRGSIHLYNQNGALLKSFDVQNNQHELRVNTSIYPSGLYYYQLEVGEQKSGGKKMIVIR